MQVGANINGDACKLQLDFGVLVNGCIELSNEANNRVLLSLPQITTDVEFRTRWSLADLTQQVSEAHYVAYIVYSSFSLMWF